MAHLELEKSIDAPVAIVFAVASDLENAAEHIEAIDKIEMLTEPPVGVGTRWRETRGKMGTETIEVVSFTPPRETGKCGYQVASDSCGCRFLCEFSFNRLSDTQTQATLTVDTTPVTFFAKIMTPLSWLMMGMMRKCLQQDLEALKRASEVRFIQPGS